MATLSYNGSQPVAVYECGHIVHLEKSLLHDIAPFWQSEAMDVCMREACGDAVVDVIPSTLLTTIRTSWNVSAETLAWKLTDATRTQTSDYIFYSLKWYELASSIKQYVCWQDPIPFDFETFEDIFGALSAVFTRPDTIYDVPLRFKSLPPGYLASGKAPCFDSNDLAYAKIKTQLPRIRKEKGHNAVNNIRNRVDEWTGAVGRSLFHLTSKLYRCSHINCIQKENVFQPQGYPGVWNTVASRMNEYETFCLALGNVNEMPQHFLIQA